MRTLNENIERYFLMTRTPQSWKIRLLGCALLLATQNLKRLHQIKEGLLEMVFANCEHLFAFGVSAACSSFPLGRPMRSNAIARSWEATA